MKHTSHTGIIKRLKVAQGHLKKTIEMMEEERSCIDIAQQLSAVESAIRSAKTNLIHDHIDHCLSETVQADDERSNTIDEFKRITKFL